VNLENKIREEVCNALKSLYGQEIDIAQVQVQKTRKEFTGDLTVILFPFLKISKKAPEATGNEIGKLLCERLPECQAFNTIKGYLNISLIPSFWVNKLNGLLEEDLICATPNDAEVIMVEYSSPNTNKPLHLGHIRNNLLGFSVSNILKAAGEKVIMVNLVNDRGIHICKSMLAWQKWGNGVTPEASGMKGDHLVGDFYVKFDREYKKQIAELIASGMNEEEAARKAPVIIEAQEMLRLWESGDKKVIELWRTMNGWVYQGFDETYKKMGVRFDRIYYESETYLLGKSLVAEGLRKGVLQQRADSSVWIDLTADGLDEKLLLRSDGTSVYMTQDIGTAHQRFEEYHPKKLIYVVGNEQNYHFQVLSLVMQKLGFTWAKDLVHLSYGMVELPSGKMKSREGTVVDADDLMDEMFATARQMATELGKLDGLSTEQIEEVVRIVGLGALKYFILKVDPKKNMTFNPSESIDFNGNTGPFIQYTYARIQSVLRKAGDAGYEVKKAESVAPVGESELRLMKLIDEYKAVLLQAAEEYSPAVLANYAYDLAKEFNQFYHDCPIIKESNDELRQLRLVISAVTGKTIRTTMELLGIEVPERM